jgi:hypothetical protein
MSVARQIRYIFDFGTTAATAGLRKGVGAYFSAIDSISRQTTARGQVFGIQVEEGTLPDGSANYGQDATHPAETVTLQTLGIAQALVPGSSTATINDQVEINSDGRAIKRTAYSVSSYLLGRFLETFTAGADPEYRADHLQPQVVEVVRQVTGGCTGAIGAATKFLTAPGSGVAAAQIPLYRARFAGEVVRNLSVNLGTAPGGADTVAFTVQKSSDNGGTWSDLAVTATISAAAKTATDLVNTATLAAGDLLAVKMVSSAGTAAAPLATFDVT